MKVRDDAHVPAVWLPSGQPLNGFWKRVIAQGHIEHPHSRCSVYSWSEDALYAIYAFGLRQPWWRSCGEQRQRNLRDQRDKAQLAGHFIGISGVGGFYSVINREHRLPGILEDSKVRDALGSQCGIGGEVASGRQRPGGIGCSGEPRVLHCQAVDHLQIPRIGAGKAHAVESDDVELWD